MNFFRFLLTRKFLRHLGIAIALSIILLLSTLLWLRFYTHHGHTITVPDLSGLTEAEVVDVTSSQNIRFEVIDSVYSTDMPRGTVVKQNPRAGTQVKKNRRIFLTMNAVNPEMVSMPRLVGLSIRQARLALQNSGLILGEISYRPDYARDNVLQQMHGDSVITEGVVIRKGETIDLVLGIGTTKEMTRIPDLIGLDLASARDRITDQHLNTGAVTYDESLADAEDSSLSFVWRQYPEFDEFGRMNKGLVIDLWLSLDSSLLPETDTLDLQGNGE